MPQPPHEPAHQQPLLVDQLNDLRRVLASDAIRRHMRKAQKHRQLTPRGALLAGEKLASVGHFTLAAHVRAEHLQRALRREAPDVPCLVAERGIAAKELLRLVAVHMQNRRTRPVQHGHAAAPREPPRTFKIVVQRTLKQLAEPPDSAHGFRRNGQIQRPSVPEPPVPVNVVRRLAAHLVIEKDHGRLADEPIEQAIGRCDGPWRIAKNHCLIPRSEQTLVFLKMSPKQPRGRNHVVVEHQQHAAASAGDEAIAHGRGPAGLIAAGKDAALDRGRAQGLEHRAFTAVRPVDADEHLKAIAREVLASKCEEALAKPVEPFARGDEDGQVHDRSIGPRTAKGPAIGGPFGS
jgi:hypothetical protein